MLWLFYFGSTKHGGRLRSYRAGVGMLWGVAPCPGCPSPPGLFSGSFICF